MHVVVPMAYNFFPLIYGKDLRAGVVCGCKTGKGFYDYTDPNNPVPGKFV